MILGQLRTGARATTYAALPHTCLLQRPPLSPQAWWWTLTFLRPPPPVPTPLVRPFSPTPQPFEQAYPTPSRKVIESLCYYSWYLRPQFRQRFIYSDPILKILVLRFMPPSPPPMSKVFPDKKFGLYGKYGKLEEMENLSDINEEEEKKKGWWRWSDIKENKIVQAFEMQQMYVCWSYFHLSSTLSICLIFSYSLKLLKIADATVVSECQSKCNVHLLLFFFLFAQLWALKHTLCAYCIQLPIALANVFCNFLLFFFLFAQLWAL